MGLYLFEMKRMGVRGLLGMLLGLCLGVVYGLENEYFGW